MATARFRRLKPGARLDEDLTVAHAVSETRGRHPVYAVWNHAAWRPMACKVFRTLADAEREHAVLAALDHPGIVRSVGVRRPALMLLEFLDGPTLSQHLDGLPDERMSLPDALRTTIHVAGAIHHLHGRGFVHMDLKPGNIAIIDDRPVLFDFGTARPIGGKAPGHVIGTTPWISPEVCRLEAATPASDVFALGVIAYELISGAMPFPEESAKDPYPQLTAATTPLRERRAGVAVGLERLVMACLASDPGLRPSLPRLMIGLHGFIRSGARMWPAEVDEQLRAGMEMVAAA